MSVTFEASRYLSAAKVRIVPRKGPNNEPIRIYNIELPLYVGILKTYKLYRKKPKNKEKYWKRSKIRKKLLKH